MEYEGRTGNFLWFVDPFFQVKTCEKEGEMWHVLGHFIVKIERVNKKKLLFVDYRYDYHDVQSSV